MNKGEFSIEFEFSKADRTDPMSQETFSITKVELDGREIATRGIDEVMLEKCLWQIINTQPKQVEEERK